MKDVFSKGIKVFFLTIVVSLISFFVVISFNAIAIGLFSEDIGYDVYGRMTEDAEPEFLYQYFLADGEDTKAEEYEAEGYELLKYSIRSEVSNGADITLSIISQICCLVILISFIYNELWKVGNKDFEATRLHGVPLNRFKGFLIGFVGVLPMYIMLAFFIITQNSISADLPIAIFTFSNCYAYEIIFAATKGAMYWADVQLWQILVYYAVLLIIPVVSIVSYFIGYKDISIAEKLIYKNSNKRRRV